MEQKVKYKKQISIAGQDITISTDISKEHLDEVFDYVQKKFNEVRKTNSFSSNLRLGIYLGLLIGDEYFQERNKLKYEIEELKLKLDKKVSFAIKDTIENAKQKNKEDLDKLNAHFIKEISILKDKNIEEVKKIKEETESKISQLENTIIKLKSEKENLDNAINIFNEEEKQKDKLIENLKRQHEEDLIDYKSVFEEEIKELGALLEDTKKLRVDEIEELKKANFKKEESIVRLVEENSIVNEENSLLRSRLEELLKINNANADTNEEYFNDEYEEFDEFEEDEIIIESIDLTHNNDKIEKVEQIKEVEEIAQKNSKDDSKSRFNRMRINKRKGKQ